MKLNYSASPYPLNQLNNFNNQNQYILNLNAKAYIASKQAIRNNIQNSGNRIMEVYENNFIQEIKNISKLLNKYPYVGMDTEFPGLVYKCPVCTNDFYYKFNKVNVDKLKLIQLGITLTNDKGEYPPNICTWQFNLNFDIEKDEYSNESISIIIILV